MALFQTGAEVRFIPVAWTAVPLLVVGLGLVVGSFLGSVRGLIGWGIALLVASALVLGGTTALSSHDQATGGQLMAVGQLDVRPSTETQLLGLYTLAAGELILDLRGLPAEDLVDRVVDVNVGMGSARVLVDEDVAVLVNGSAGVGEVRLLGQTAAGMAPRLSRIDPEGATELFLELNVRAGIGEVDVRRSR
jgi:hypothetical protein